ncbi:asparagine synthase-related protein [Scytonema sp. PCC 10023]|uniref:asparagine synthase-related protein n=1 Tax=Scytonema sp. PCC 10023 TaxID=1680591 RepID=UPI0039C6E3DE
MANFFVVVDPDHERRSQFVKKIEPLLPPVEGLVTNSCSVGNFCAVWAASSTAPISHTVEQQDAAVIWGDAMHQTKAARINADGLLNLWKDSTDNTYSAFNGFYAAVTYHQHYGLKVGADLLGLFPVYYYTHGEVALVGSSPELFRYHPLFQPAFNPAGLVGILLTNGLFDGQTLWQGIKRLDAGCLLFWQVGTSAKELRQYQLPKSEKDSEYSQLSFAEQVELLAQALEQAIAQYDMSGKRASLLLSGGIDSRMLAGFLRRQNVDVAALTLGRRTDIEMRCAASVARTLAFEHHTATVPFAQYPACADTVVRWEHLANGFNVSTDWGILCDIKKLAPTTVTGYLMDRVVGGSAPYSPSPDEMSYEAFFDNVNCWGFPPNLLKRLLRQEVFYDLVQDTLARIRIVYESYPGTEFRRSWWFEIFHSNRFHVGSSAWQLSFGAWPILPVLNWQLLEVSALLPEKTIAQRRAQMELLCTYFPQLAQLPLDRNAYNLEPLLGRKNQFLAPLVKLQRRWWQFQQQKLGYERRYYFRTYDFNNDGWRAIRQQAELYRDHIRCLFHEDVFNALLPTPDVRTQYKDPIIDASGIKALVGLLLWSKEHI